MKVSEEPATCIFCVDTDYCRIKFLWHICRSTYKYNRPPW